MILSCLNSSDSLHCTQIKSILPKSSFKTRYNCLCSHLQQLAPSLLCPYIHVPSHIKLFLSLGPLHMLFPLSKIHFLPLLSWSTISDISGFNQKLHLQKDPLGYLSVRALAGNKCHIPSGMKCKWRSPTHRCAQGLGMPTRNITVLRS